MLRYALLTGVASWGVPMFVTMTFFVPHPRLSVPASAALWLIAGAGFGITTWLVHEYRYHKASSTPHKAD